MSVTWRKAITEEMSIHGDSWNNVESCTLKPAELDHAFDDGYGCEEGTTFSVWTGSRVYFPACYDGSEWAASVSRNPDGKPTDHIGGG